jgi:hypothetical protein
MMRYVVLPLGLLFLLSRPAQAYFVAPAASLEVLTTRADVIFKGTAVSNVPGNGKWFRPILGYLDQETQFTVVSTIKGEIGGETLKFRHYDYNAGLGWAPYTPPYYHFEIGRTYLVFAKRTDTTGIFQPLSIYPSAKPDEGVYLCANDKPVSARSTKEIAWSELTGMLASEKADISYGIRQLDQMSGGGGWRTWDAVADFDRKDVLSAVHGFVTNPDAGVARAAISVVGSHNPYMIAGVEDQSDGWLATVGSGDAPGLSKMDANVRNLGGELYSRELVGVAESNADSATRALAILALGLVRQPELEKPIERWLSDSSPAVRASATLLLADFPRIATRNRLEPLARDGNWQVRESAALSVGFGQLASKTDIASRLLSDSDRRVRKAAAMSLLSFSPRNKAIAAIFKANLKNQEFAPLFLNALAREDPAPYVDDLSNAVETPGFPKNWSGGESPQAYAWDILLHYLEDQPVEVVTSGKLDRYLDAVEQVGKYSSSEPMYLYAFYVQRGMTKRAIAFRQKADAAAIYNVDPAFQQVDRVPWSYMEQWPHGPDPDPVKYMLEVRTKYLTVGQAPEFRVNAANVSSKAIDHDIIPGTLGFALRMDGSQGGIWWLQRSATEPHTIRLAPGQQDYIFGSSSSYVNSGQNAFATPGYYNFRYCDEWSVGNISRTICSNEIQIHVSE